MTLSRREHASNFNVFAHALCTIALASSINVAEAQQRDWTAIEAAGHSLSDTSREWHSDEAVHLIGLPEIKEKQKGSLSISPAAVTFASPEGRATLQRREISNVTIGDVSIETGGTAGKITRAIIPFGGGSAMATITHKQFSLLTIESRNERNALHGAVFLLPKDVAVQAEEQLGLQVLPTRAEPPHGRCVVRGGVLPDSIMMSAIASSGEPVPAEYRVLLYEQLVRRLREGKNFTAVYRDGDDDPAATCPKYTLVLTMNVFKKGNAAVRASTGPVGFFVGATSLKFHVQIQDLDGKMLFEKDLRSSQRGDTDSLNIPAKIAKSLTKDILKASAHASRI